MSDLDLVSKQNQPHLTRPARVLVGWLPEQEAALWLASRRSDLSITPAYLEKAKLLRANAAGIRRNAPAGNVLTSPPETLNEHIKAWSNHPANAAIIAEGWRIAIADLSMVIALQPLVHTDNTAERTKGIAKEDMLSIASLSIQIPADQPLTVNFDPSHQTWTFSSANPNLQILGQFNLQLQPGLMGFGFAVGIPNSYMQIAAYQNRYLLRDGYHRAYSLLKAGITKVPVMHKEFGTSTELALPPGLFPHDTYLGETPPLLTDYLNDDVSADIQMQATQKVVIIQGIQASAAG